MTKKKERREMSSEERADIVSAYKAGALASQLASKYMRSNSVIYHALRAAGVPTQRSEKMKGNADSKTDSKVESVRKRRTGGGKNGKKRARVGDSVVRANAALRASNNRTSSVRHAVIVLMKTLEHEEIHELSIDFNRNVFHVKRVHVEEGKV